MAPSPSKPEPPKTARKRPPQISDAEWVVMKLFWQRSPRTANEVVEALKGEADWKPKTIHTLIRRLVQKHALTFEKSGREHLFRPLIQAETCLRHAGRSFLQRLFDGRLAPFVACMLHEEQLDSADLAELRKLLESQSPS